jgi:uncharacterized protein YjbI with pentapeptide repeats
VKVENFLNKCFEKAKKYPRIWICLIILLAAISLIWLPYWQVSQFGINNATENATLQNQYRITIAQILGGVAVAFGIYFAWGNLKVTQDNLKVAQEGQITERFTRAIDQFGATDKLGNPAIEIRLGGIHALGRIATESKKDCWPIMEILTAYIRNHSPGELSKLEIKDIECDEGSFEKEDPVNLSHDIEAILTVIRRSKQFLIPTSEEQHHLDLHNTYLYQAYLQTAYLERVNFSDSYLSCATLEDANLQNAYLQSTNLKGAYLKEAKLQNADLENANLQIANLKEANLKEANLQDVDLQRANLTGADLTRANLRGANLKEAKNLTVDQLSKVKTLYNAKLDEELLIPLKKDYPALFDKPED